MPASLVLTPAADEIDDGSHLGMLSAPGDTQCASAPMTADSDTAAIDERLGDQRRCHSLDVVQRPIGEFELPRLRSSGSLRPLPRSGLPSRRGRGGTAAITAQPRATNQFATALYRKEVRSYPHHDDRSGLGTVRHPWACK